MLARIPSEDPHGGRSIYSPKSHKWTIGSKPTTDQPKMNLIFQEDSAPSHRSKTAQTWLHATYPILSNKKFGYRLHRI